MRLTENTKALVLGNVELIKYVQDNALDMEILKKCHIEKMGNDYVFGLPKANPPKSKCILPLDVDLDTQPDIVLILNTESGKVVVEPTSKTKMLLKK